MKSGTFWRIERKKERIKEGKQKEKDKDRRREEEQGSNGEMEDG